jgi:hypothetical protein
MQAAVVSRFTYPSYRQLEITIGRIDAVAAFTELSVRELVGNAKDGNILNQLRLTAARHHLNLTHVDVTLLPLRTTRLHIVSVHQVFMEFLRDFRREHPDGQSWEPKRIEDPMVQHVWRNTVGSKNMQSEQTSELRLVEYYRFARNRFVHATTEKQPKIEGLRELVGAHPALQKLDGPNTYKELKFDDVIIFARSCLGVANTICKNSLPTETQVVSMVRSLDGIPAEPGIPAVRLKEYRKLKHNVPRLHQKLGTLLRSLYGLEPDHSKRIINDLACGLLAYW